jgi:hypothetical protein
MKGSTGACCNWRVGGERKRAREGRRGREAGLAALGMARGRWSGSWSEQQREVTARGVEGQRAESRAESREVQTMPDTDADGLLR